MRQFYINLTNQSNASIFDAQGIGTITNDDADPIVTLSVNNTSITENGTATVTATLSAVSTKDVTVTLEYTGTATGSGTDYTASAATITIAAGSTTGTVTITAVSDTLDEIDETVITDIASVTNGTESVEQQVTTTITDDDDAPTISVNDRSAAEGNTGTTTLAFTVSLSAPSGKAITVDYTTANGTGTAGTDYTAISTMTLTFAIGETSKTVNVTISGDIGYEPDENFYINLTAPTNSSISDAQGIGTIANDDADPTVTLSVNNANIAENAGVATVTATLSAASTKDVTVTLGYTGTATGSGTDYTASAVTITIVAGSTTGTVTIAAVSDTLDEIDETVITDITSVTNGTESVEQQVTTTITDDDDAPAISVNDRSADEGNAGTTTLTFTVTLSAPSSKTITVDYATANGTGTAGTDYTAIGTMTLTFTAGETSKTISVTISGDIGYEPDENFYINLTNQSNASISDTQGIGTITNDDAAPTVTMSINNTSITENGTATVTATLSAVSSEDVTVTLGYTGTATGSGADYTASSITIIITAANTTGTATITAVNDALDEIDETVIVDINSVTNGTESGAQQVTTTITDDDIAPTISVNDTSVAEGDTGTTALAFTVMLSAPSSKIITVDYATANGTATAGTDYTAISTTMLTFAAGETSKTVNVMVTGDTDTESDVTILLNLLNATNSSISDTQGSGTISDDDTPDPPTPPTNDAVVEVNGEKQNAGQSSTETTGDTTTTTITVDDTKLNTILEKEGNNATVTLPASGTPDVVVGELNGQTVKNMENKEATLEIKTETVTYTLPASQINIDAVSSLLGSQVGLKDIKVSVRIADPPADTVKIVEDAANSGNYQLVVKPVEFQITCTSGSQTIEVSQFNGYVERTIEIPEGVDPSKITTGIVLNDDGTFRHVPTQIVLINGKYYAKINSLTNSTYSVMYNPVIFADVETHWAKDAINDMGSRMVVKGVGNGIYEPERSITRAEFATIIVRALGLAEDTTASAFGDVKLTDWFNGYVVTATAYNLITGYDSTHFGPNDTITREQAMTILARAMKLTGISISLTDSEASALLSNYTDKGLVSDYAKASAAACIKRGIVYGTTTSTLSPKDILTRAEAAAIIQRLLQKSGLI